MYSYALARARHALFTCLVGTILTNHLDGTKRNLTKINHICLFISYLCPLGDCERHCFGRIPDRPVLCMISSTRVARRISDTRSTLLLRYSYCVAHLFLFFFQEIAIQNVSPAPKKTKFQSITYFKSFSTSNSPLSAAGAAGAAAGSAAASPPRGKAAMATAPPMVPMDN